MALVAHGESTSGSKHSLEVDVTPGSRIPVGGFKFTVMGPNGKRHASVKLDTSDIRSIIEYMQDQLAKNPR